MSSWKIGFLIFLSHCFLSKGSDPVCGFPGTPAYGYVKPDEAAYYEGDIISYSCRVGYILLGSHIRRCTKDGSWTDEVPICDDSMTTLGFASSTPAVLGHSAELAIDRDKNTCTYLKKKNPRWWRIDLGSEYKVLSVAVTVPSPDKHMKFTVYVIGIHGTTASYNRCASFSGKFGTQTIVLSCSEGKGIEGGKVHIEDHMINENLFELCEVEVQVEKDTGYDCGRPSRNIYSITFDSSGDTVEYGCIRGYEIIGNDYRTCLNSGQWSGEPPVCKPIICHSLSSPGNGQVEIIQGNRSTPLEGATAAYKCHEGFKLVGPFTRECLRDGSWSGTDSQCKAIRCPIPEGKTQYEFYRLVNKTNSMGSMAMLRCKRGKREGDNPYITCTEDGHWTKPDAHCILPAGASYEEEPRIVNQGAVIFGMVVAAVMIVFVLVALYLYTQRRRNADKPQLPSRFQEPLVAPPRPPPRAKSNAFKTAIMGFMSHSGKPEEDIELKSWKTQSLPSDHDMSDPNSPKKLRSFGGSLSDRQDDQPAVIEVEVLAHEASANKGKFRSVPEENEDENLGLDEENNEGSAKEQLSGADYAAVDYEKKRQSRLLKQQDSMESSSTAAASPIPTDDADKPPSPPPKSMSQTESEEESEEISSEDERENKEEEERKAKEEEERKAKEEEEKKAKEEEEKKAKEEAEKKAKEEEEKKAKEESDLSTRRKRRTEPPPPVEDKPVLRRFRR